MIKYSHTQESLECIGLRLRKTENLLDLLFNHFEVLMKRKYIKLTGIKDQKNRKILFYAILQLTETFCWITLKLLILFYLISFNLIHNFFIYIISCIIDNEIKKLNVKK